MDTDDQIEELKAQLEKAESELEGDEFQKLLETLQHQIHMSSTQNAA